MKGYDYLDEASFHRFCALQDRAKAMGYHLRRQDREHETFVITRIACGVRKYQTPSLDAVADWLAD